MLELNTALRGPVDIDEGQFVSAVFQHGTPTYDEAKVLRIAQAYVKRTAEFGFRTSIIAGQSFHETGFYTYGGQVQPEQNNYAGLGATNDGKQGGAWATEDQGVLAHMAHMALYVYGEPQNWPENVRQYASYAYRLSDVRGARYLGVIHVIGDFTNGRWAWTPRIPLGSLDNGYASGICECGNYVLGVKAMSFPAILTEVPGVPFEVRIVPAGNPNRPAYPMVPEFITVHNTANYNVGAGADMHASFLANGGGKENVSFHFVVDDHKVIQLLPMNENGWHAGDGANGTGNRKSIAIEVCDNADADYGATLKNAALLIAHLRTVLAISAENTVQHNKWSGKDCPRDIRRNPGWAAFMQTVQSANPQAAYEFAGDTHALYFDETGHHLSNGFRGYWEQNGGLRVFGFPLTEEFTASDTGLSTQVFERMVLEYDGNAPEDWRVRGRFVTSNRGPVDWAAIVPAGAWERAAR